MIPSPSHSEGDASKRSDARRGCPSQPNRSRQLERPTPPKSHKSQFRRRRSEPPLIPPWTSRGRDGRSPLDDEGEGLIPPLRVARGTRASGATLAGGAQPTKPQPPTRTTNTPKSNPIIQITQITVKTTRPRPNGRPGRPLCPSEHFTPRAGETVRLSPFLVCVGLCCSVLSLLIGGYIGLCSERRCGDEVWRWWFCGC